MRLRDRFFLMQATEEKFRENEFGLLNNNSPTEYVCLSVRISPEIYNLRSRNFARTIYTFKEIIFNRKTILF